MGRASRRKRRRARAAPSPAPEGGSRPLRRLLPIAGAALLAAGLAAWFVARDPVDRGADTPEPAPAPSAALPDPDTSDMTPPVARVIRQARRAALARPESAAAAGRLGQVLQAHWLNDEAAQCYEIARELAPEDFRWVYLLAGVEDIRGADADRIDELFREAIRLQPGFPPAYVRHADALMRLGRWSEARDAYAEAVERDPDLVLAHRGLGQAAILLEDGPAAVEHLEEAARLAPGDRITQTALARAYALVGEGDLAAEAAHKARTLEEQASIPDPIFFEVQNLAVDPESLRGRVSRALEKGDWEAATEALTLLEESAGPAVRGQLAHARKQRANQLAFGGDFEAALAEFEVAAALAPDDPEIEHNRGTVLLRRGDLEAAGRHFERAIELDPRSADSLYNLGVVLEGLGRQGDAIEHFEAAAAINPGHVAARRLAELGVPPD